MSKAESSEPPIGFLGVAPLLGHIALAAISRLVTYPLRNVRCTSLYDDVLYAALRCLLSRWTIAQSRYLNATTTTERYLAHCKQQNVEPNTMHIKNAHGELAAHWIGTPNADATIVYYHGGGYSQPATDAYFVYLERLIKHVNSDKSCRSIAVLMPAYTLAPEATHPSQLQQGVAVLSHLISDLHRSPSSIFVFGDSAGGNLALSVLSHILHPHPDVPSLKLEQPLAGMLLISPWAAFHPDYQSFEDNKILDMLTPLALRKGSAIFLGKTNTADPESDPGWIVGDAWTEASLNAASWWHGSHQVVSNVVVWSGGYELFRDPIKELKRHLVAGWIEAGGASERVAFIESPREAHIQPIMDTIVLSGRTKSDAQHAIEEWVKARLQV
ncbi:alpha/beta-hydrolase [Plenodomus tracheiphilus IPT5]|uniref:Alpha/beta-hydrolase n=1 Tax=Plenodomus tracheiphilus IPT5 TaxID=1408161 RepID=A0A6A7AZ42_9PLEO|nr:alpha/beta-hydrolase [Plenodomus tracheiphilus IPT5]